MGSGRMYAGGDETHTEEDSVHSTSALLISGREGTKCLDRQAPVRTVRSNTRHLQQYLIKRGNCRPREDAVVNKA